MEYPSNSDNDSSGEWQNNPNSLNYTETHNMIRWKSGKMIDLRLLALLESFGEIYMDRREFFRKIFDGDYEELFEKIRLAMKKKKQMKKARSMPRSLSMRGARERGIDGEIDGLRLDRFKVRTPNVAVVGMGDGQSGQGQGQASQGSKDSK